MSFAEAALPIPEATEADTPESILGRILRREAPGIVVRSPDGSLGMTTVGGLAAYIRAHHGRMDTEDKLPQGTRDAGWHWDKHRTTDNEFASINAHRTTIGLVTASLVVPRPAFWRDMPARVYNMLPVTAAQLDDGQVDPEFFEPGIYTAQLGPGDVLVFGLDGEKPTIHNFVSQTRVRRSYAHLGDIPIDPALGY